MARRKKEEIKFYNNNFDDFINKSVEEQIRLLTNSNKYGTFKIYDEALFEIITTINNALKEEIISFTEIDWISSRYPDVEFIYSLISNLVIFSSNRNNLLNIKFRVNKLRKKNIFKNEADIDDNKIKIEKDLKNIIIDIFNKNNINLMLYYITYSLVKYGVAFVYTSDDYKFIELIEPKHIGIFVDKNNKNIDDIDKLEFRDKRTNEKLDNNRLFVISTRGLFGEPLFKKAYIYFKIINILENANLIERLIKSKTLFVWKVDISQISDVNEISIYLSRIRQAINDKISIQLDENTDINNQSSLFSSVSLNISSSLTNSHIIIPTFSKDGISIETLKNDYKPIYEDIDRLWDKIYMVAQLPRYFLASYDAKSTPREFIILQDELFSSKIRFYQSILNQFLNNWISKLLNTIGYIFESIDIRLQDYQPISERKETDLEKATKSISIFTQLENIIGIPIKIDFILKKLFPSDNIEDILDLDRLKENNINDILQINNYNTSDNNTNNIYLVERLKSFIENLNNNKTSLDDLNISFIIEI